MKFRNFKGVDLFRVGTWTDSKGRKNKWTHADIDGIVDAYNKTKESVHAPLKLGHNDKQKIASSDDDEPAIGWVENLKRVGDKLVGDFMNVPDKLADLIEKGAYRSRSAELYPDFEVAGTTYKWLLTGVALLGGRLPAVNGLDDILALYKKEDIEYDDDIEVVLYESEGAEDDDDFDEELESFLGRINNAVRGKKGAPHIRALQSALRNAINATRGKRSNSKIMDTEKIAILLGLKKDASEAEIEAALKTRNEKEDEENEDVSKNAKKPDPEIAELRNKILTLEKSNAVSAASMIVDAAITAGKILPKQKEFALNYAQNDPEGFAKFVEAQPSVVEFGERGSADKSKIDFALFEPTADDIAVAKAIGTYGKENWRVNLMKEKASAKGITLTDEMLKAKSNT